jgi:hypothetical protein
VSAATFIDNTHVDVVFDQAMANDAVLITTTNYVLSGVDTPIVSNVLRTNATTVRLTVPFTAIGLYTVTVSNVTNLAGDIIDPAHNSANFVAALVIPQDVILFGGWDSAALYNDTWKWDGATWTKPVPATSPTVRYYGSLAHDSPRKTSVTFGGYTWAGVNGETWEWNGITWAQKAAGGVPGVDKPIPIWEHAIAYDAARNVSVLFGGLKSGPAVFQDKTWTWNGVTWVLAEAGGGGGVTNPSARIHHVMAYDSVRNVIVLFGGTDAATQKDTWEWNGVAWTMVHNGGIPGTNSPAGCSRGAMAYDAMRNVCVYFDGSAVGGIDKTWEWNGGTATWTKVHNGGSPGVGNPGARFSHAMAYDSSRNITVLFGGFLATGTPAGDTWEWNGTTATWTQKAIGGVFGVDKPNHRWGHGMCYHYR